MKKPNSADILGFLITLLEKQEGVKITYEIVRAENGERMADRRAG